MARQPKVVDVEPVGRRSGCRWLVLVLLLLMAAGAAVWYFMFRAPGQGAPRRVTQAIDVRSNIVQEGDSLRVVVDWRLVLPRGPEIAESARVEVGVDDGAISQVATVPANEYTDTLRVPAPQAGQTASGYSCAVRRGSSCARLPARRRPTRLPRAGGPRGHHGPRQPPR